MIRRLGEEWRGLPDLLYVAMRYTLCRQLEAFSKAEQPEMAGFDESVSQIAGFASLGFPSTGAAGLTAKGSTWRRQNREASLD
jgi:hypothetical protein